MADVTGTILEGKCARMPFYTDLAPIFQAFHGREKEYDWLITELDSEAPEFQSDAPIFMGGGQLSSIVRERSLGQFIWGVFTGFPKGTRLDLSHLAVVPHAEENREMWLNPPRIQYPGAMVELICWDSTSTVLITTDSVLNESFRKFFPEARDLEIYNRLRAKAG